MAVKVLYVVRDRVAPGVIERLRVSAWGLLDGQDGFFEAALHRASRVTRLSLAEVEALPRTRRRSFDAVVVNAKSGLDVNDPSAVSAFCGDYSCPVVLFVGAARADVMPPDAALTPFHLVFKHEPFADPGRYRLGNVNADKIRPTHLSNPLHPLSWRLPWLDRHRSPRRFGWQVCPTTDVSFLGRLQDTQFFSRQESWSRVLQAGLEASGGLIQRRHMVPPERLAAAPMPRGRYLRQILETRVNLGLEGIGTFTHRHLEILWAGAFLLSNPAVRLQRLRTPLVEGEDYVAFDDHDDMIDKIRHYAARGAERIRIAQNGRRAYERLHDVRAHAAEIRAGLIS